ncbi:hypothetical protein [Streptomyces sp. NPDC057729]|uniref:hypothetical protein n=1 Tax=Streptomyces sp. NPDC057729 TaxID=3346230 RepID=UPI0036A02A27
MDKTWVPVFAACITATAAFTAGMLAFLAAVRNIRRAAVVQREQAFWQSRRDTYVGIMQSFSKFDRASLDCLTAYQEGDFSGAHLEKLTDACFVFEEARFAMLLEAPHDPIIASALKVANRKLQALLHLCMNWKHAADEGDEKAQDLEYWNDEAERHRGKFGQARNSLFVAMRNDLHREIGGDFVHGPIRFRLAKGRKRKYQEVPPLPDDD